MAQPSYDIIRVKWGKSVDMTAALNNRIAEIVIATKQEVRVVGQSHTSDFVLYTVQVGK